MIQPVNKAQLLQSLEQRVEEHLQQAIHTYQNLTEAELLKPAASGGWSIAQCLDHLNSYGHYYLPWINKGVSAGKKELPSDTFKSSWLGSYFTRTMDPASGKKKYKALKGHIPPPTLDAYTVVAEFIQQQESLLQYLTEAKSANLDRFKIPITISKWIRLKLGDVFQFLIAHNHRHVLQANRNLPYTISQRAEAR